MRLICTQSIQSVLLQNASNAPVVVTLDWREKNFVRSSTLRIDRAIAEAQKFPLGPDVPGDSLDIALDLVENVDRGAIEARKELVELNMLSSLEIVSGWGRTKHRYGQFLSPQRSGTAYLGGGGVVPACPLYHLEMPLSQEEYETLAELLLSAGTKRHAVWFAFTFAHKQRAHGYG